MMHSTQEIADALDYAVLRPTATVDDIRIACELVLAHNIRTICVAPIYARKAVELGAPVCAVVGFPHGTSTPSQKRNEANALMEDGVKEVDVVINYGRLLDGESEVVERELTAIIDLARQQHVIVKAILEACYYTMTQLDWASRLCAGLGVDFIKSSTGYGLHGATVQNIKTMVQAVQGTNVQVKASGGIVTYNDAAKFLDLGCTRLGASRFKELLP